MKNPKSKPMLKPKEETIVQVETIQNNVPSGQELLIGLRGVIHQAHEHIAPQTDPVEDDKPQTQTQSGEPTIDELIASAKQKSDELDRQKKKVIAEIAQYDVKLKMLNGENLQGRISPFLPLSQQKKDLTRTGIEMKRFMLKQQHQLLLDQWAKVFFQLYELEERKKLQPKIQMENPPKQEKKMEGKIVEMKKQEEIIHVPVVSEFGDVITSKELSEKTFIVLDFKGKWRDFIGKPSPTFLAAVYGKAGGGKSTCCFQWAVDLAKNHGKVLFISAEEGIVLTLQEKLKITSGNDQIPNLFFGAQKSLAEIKKGIPQNTYHFIFLDSLSTLRIDAAGLEEFGQHFPNCGIIAILQSTKSGSMRGSQEIIHDCDIEICVANGIATTKKNRFIASGKRYRVFDDDDGKTGKKEKPSEPPINLV
ncbi:MAG: hypothetical protein NT084_13330 [Bacteroidetes bacterium]|nr:hypothetical protein [Bacteroidota bacterium]